MRRINSIVIHCTDSDIDSHDEDLLNVVTKWHVEERGWRDVGYHYLIHGNGSIEIGRPIWLQGAHAKDFNAWSVGIALHGIKVFSKLQMQSVKKLVLNLLAMYNLTADNVYGHYEIKSALGKTCPNIDMDEFRKNLKEI